MASLRGAQTSTCKKLTRFLLPRQKISFTMIWVCISITLKLQFILCTSVVCFMFLAYLIGQWIDLKLKLHNALW